MHLVWPLAWELRYQVEESACIRWMWECMYVGLRRIHLRWGTVSSMQLSVTPCYATPSIQHQRLPCTVYRHAIHMVRPRITYTADQENYSFHFPTLLPRFFPDGVFHLCNLDQSTNHADLKTKKQLGYINPNKAYLHSIHNYPKPFYVPLCL